MVLSSNCNMYMDMICRNMSGFLLDKYITLDLSDITTVTVTGIVLFQILLGCLLGFSEQQ